MMKTYEAMFLVDPVTASKDGKMPDHVHNILDKYKVNILKEIKWADRSLAYKIKGHRRGTYYLSYFETEPENLSKIRRECNLSTALIRVLILLIEPAMKEKALNSVKETVAPIGVVTAETKK